MRYHALAADFDGTLVHDGVMTKSTADALQKLKSSGRKLLMVTGRELDELLEICPQVELFDRIVAENGALAYRPDTKEVQVLAEPPPERLVLALRRRGVNPLSVGRAIVATVEPHHEPALEAIRELGLEYQVIFNKGAVMLLPSGVNKATGLSAILTEMGLSRHNVVGVGDAENDHAFLNICECAVAVANALAPLKERADFVTQKPRGEGVEELIEALLADELVSILPTLSRHRILLGKRDDEQTEAIDPYGADILVCGTSGSGKSTLTTGLLERFATAGYQFVVIDPEGDYSELELAVSLGSAERPPVIDEILDLLRDPGRSAAVNLLGVALEHRPAFCDQLLPRLLEMRARTGRPHWIIIDEAHHLLPTGWGPAQKHLPVELNGVVYITVHPGSISLPLLKTLDAMLVIGKSPQESLDEFCEAVGRPVPTSPVSTPLPTGDAILWRLKDPNQRPVLVHTERPKSERKRHSRKYAEGNLGPDRSFFFRGPERKLNLKASNLFLFLELADGVDDDTWMFHLHARDYSKWLREQIKDDDLAADVGDIEAHRALSPRESRAAVRKAIEARYTLPADKASGIVD